MKLREEHVSQSVPYNFKHTYFLRRTFNKKWLITTSTFSLNIYFEVSLFKPRTQKVSGVRNPLPLSLLVFAVKQSQSCDRPDSERQLIERHITLFKGFQIFVHITQCALCAMCTPFLKMLYKGDMRPCRSIHQEI